MRERPVVVVIDDEPDIRMVLVEMLRDEGYEVVEAADGEAGLEAVERAQPDVIILDLLMPRLDGAGFLERHLQTPEPRAPVIMASASSKYLGVPLPVGADAYADKPFDVEHLLKLMTTVRAR